MAVKVDNMKRIETPVVLDVPGSQKIGLVDVVDAQGVAEIGIFHPFGGVGSFFLRGILFGVFSKSCG